MFDGDVDYTLNIGMEQGETFNFAYIIDTSGSMAGLPLKQTKDAFIELTQSLVDNGFGFRSEFVVTNFGSSASTSEPSSAGGIIPVLNSLRATGGTNFRNPLLEAARYFDSPFRINNATNIAYFVSDGLPDNTPYIAEANKLKELTNIRAFGIGNASLASLNPIDSSGSASILSDPGDLFNAFNSPLVDKNTIDRIDVKLADQVIETIAPEQLSENGANLTFKGTIEGLEVSRLAENEVTFELVFKAETGIANVSLDYKITTGQEEVRQQSKNGQEEIITFSVNQNDFIDSQNNTLVSFASNDLADITNNTAIEREIIGNDLNNTFEIRQGDNNLFGNGGDDRFILLGGINLVNGGEGIDTVRIDRTQAEAGGVTKNGSIVNIGTDNTLLNVEFIEFGDIRLAVDTLAITPILLAG